MIMVTRLTIKFYFEFLVGHSLWGVRCRISSSERLMVMLPNTITHVPDSYLCPSLSSDTCTDGCDLYCLYEATQPSVNWQKDEGPEVTFTLMTVPKSAINPPSSCPGFCDYRGHLIMKGRVWNSGATNTSRYGHGAGTPCSMTEDHSSHWHGQVRGPEHSYSDTALRFQFVFST